VVGDAPGHPAQAFRPPDLVLVLFDEKTIVLDLPGFRDVQASPHKPKRTTLGVPVRHFALVQHPHPSTGFGEESVFGLVIGGVAQQVRVENLHDMGQVIGVDQLFPGSHLGFERVAGIAQHFGPAIIEADFAGDHIPVPHAQVCTHERQFESFFAFPQLVLGSGALSQLVLDGAI